MDHFHEEVVIKRNKTFDEIVYYFSWVVIVLCGAFALLQFSSISAALRNQTLPMTIISGLLAAAVAVGIYFYHDMLSIFKQGFVIVSGSY